MGTWCSPVVFDARFASIAEHGRLQILQAKVFVWTPVSRGFKSKQDFLVFKKLPQSPLFSRFPIINSLFDQKRLFLNELI